MYNFHAQVQDVHIGIFLHNFAWMLACYVEIIIIFLPKFKLSYMWYQNFPQTLAKIVAFTSKKKKNSFFSLFSSKKDTNFKIIHWFKSSCQKELKKPHKKFQLKEK